VLESGSNICLADWTFLTVCCDIFMEGFVSYLRTWCPFLSGTIVNGHGGVEDPRMSQ
jgi:hypothetical protein